MHELEQRIRMLTTALNGQYPRPWMTTLLDPSQAKVFVVGYNPAKAFLTADLNHDRHIDALFNRNGESCHALYAELTQESPTRGNIAALTDKLGSAGVNSVLETNVICYATRKSSDLRSPENAGGKARGATIFYTLVDLIRPRVIILHGAGVRKEFNRIMGNKHLAPPPSTTPDVFPQSRLANGTRVFIIPSLALPGYQNWPPRNSFCNWADTYLNQLAPMVAQACND